MGRAAGRAVPRDRTAGLGPRRTHTGVWLGGLDYLGMAIPHFAAIFFVGSRFASRGGRLRNDLDPTLRRLRAPIRATQTSARYGRGESSREMERVCHDPLCFFREIGVSGLLFHLASAFLVCREFAYMQPAKICINKAGATRCPSSTPWPRALPQHHRRWSV